MEQYNTTVFEKRRVRTIVKRNYQKCKWNKFVLSDDGYSDIILCYMYIICIILCNTIVNDKKRQIENK